MTWWCRALAWRAKRWPSWRGLWRGEDGGGDGRVERPRRSYCAAAGRRRLEAAARGASRRTAREAGSVAARRDLSRARPDRPRCAGAGGLRRGGALRRAARPAREQRGRLVAGGVRRRRWRLRERAQDDGAELRLAGSP